MADNGRQREWLLAVDTSSLSASIAIVPVDLESRGAELTWDAGRNQTASLLGQLDSILHLVGIEVADLSAVAVATGPGSFNALRVGMSLAKGLCFARGIPIIGVGTLDALASAFVDRGQPVRAFVDAGRQRVVVGDYRPSGDMMLPRGGLEHCTRDELADGLIEPTILAGDLSREFAEQLAANDRVILPPPAMRTRRAAQVLDVAARRWAAGDVDDLMSLEPVYIHSQPKRTVSGDRSS